MGTIVQDRRIARNARDVYAVRSGGHPPAMTETPRQPTFADVLNDLMEARGLSQAALARALDTYDGNVRRWRTGAGIEIENVRKLATFFGVDRAYIERLAGYGDSSLSSADDSDPTFDQQVSALLDADKLNVHEELSGVDIEYWPYVLEAGRVARAAAAKLARMATGGDISKDSSSDVSNAGPTTRKGAQGRKTGRRSDLPEVFDTPRPHSSLLIPALSWR